MTLTTSPASASSAFDALAPLRLPVDLRLTPEQYSFGEGFAYELVCAENREAVLELSADGRLIQLTATGSETGARNSRLVMRLLLWANAQGGWKVFGSSSSFRLPDGSVLSPDASLVRLERWQALTAEQRAVEVWPASGEPQRIDQAELLDGGPEFPGLQLALAEIWNA